MEGSQGIHKTGWRETQRKGGEPRITGVGEGLLRGKADVGLRMCTWIRLVADMEVTFAKDRVRRGDQFLLERREEE